MFSDLGQFIEIMLSGSPLSKSERSIFAQAKNLIELLTSAEKVNFFNAFNPDIPSAARSKSYDNLMQSLATKNYMDSEIIKVSLVIGYARRAQFIDLDICQEALVILPDKRDTTVTTALVQTLAQLIPNFH